MLNGHRWVFLARPSQITPRVSLTARLSVKKRWEWKGDGPMEARNKEAGRDSAVRETTNRLLMCRKTFRLKGTRNLTSP